MRGADRDLDAIIENAPVDCLLFTNSGRYIQALTICLKLSYFFLWFFKGFLSYLKAFLKEKHGGYTTT